MAIENVKVFFEKALESEEFAKATVDAAVGMLRKAGRHEQADGLLKEFNKLSYRS